MREMIPREFEPVAGNDPPDPRFRAGAPRFDGGPEGGRERKRTRARITDFHHTEYTSRTASGQEMAYGLHAEPVMRFVSIAEVARISRSVA